MSLMSELPYVATSSLLELLPGLLPRTVRHAILSFVAKNDRFL